MLYGLPFSASERGTGGEVCVGIPDLCCGRKTPGFKVTPLEHLRRLARQLSVDCKDEIGDKADGQGSLLGKTVRPMGWQSRRGR